MKRAFLILGIAAALVGCGSSGEVSSSDVKSKEKQAEEATAKLNGGAIAPQGQAQGDQ